MKHQWQLKLLFDGQCPLCSREVALLRKLDRQRGRLAFEDISQAEFDPRRYGLTLEQVVGHMHALQSDGTVVRGMEVFRQAYATVGLGWLLAPTAWPVLRHLFDWLYRRFAAVRPRLSRFACEGACVQHGLRETPMSRAN